MIMDADIVQFGEAPLSMIKARVKAGKIVIRNSERRYKSKSRYLKWPIYTYQSLIYNKGYLLASSAFAPRDYMLSGMKPNRMFMWGYFPEVKYYDNIEEIFERKQKNLGLKHPESTIEVAKMLNLMGVRYELNIIGAGPLEDKIKALIDNNGLSENVHILGPVPPEKVRKHMEQADIFLFTSDQNEGWGATLNESMNSACAVVAGHMIGSVPFLMKDNENGMIFKSKDWSDLCEKVKYLVSNPKERERLGRNAYTTITETWSPKVAGDNLVKLYDALLSGKETPINEGPCSKANIISSNWMKN